jgi:hypothetical protein
MTGTRDDDEILDESERSHDDDRRFDLMNLDNEMNDLQIIEFHNDEIHTEDKN